MKISFLLPGYPAGPSGGYGVVYRYANGLVRRGHTVAVIHPYCLRGSPAPTLAPAETRRATPTRAGTRPAPTEHHPPWSHMPPAGRRCWRKLLQWKRTTFPPRIAWQEIDSRVNLIYLRGEPFAEFMPDADRVVATAWETATYVAAYPPEKGAKLHYIADYERWVGASAEIRIAMGEALSLPLNKIAVSRVAAAMARPFTAPGTPIQVAPLGLDQSRYRVTKPIECRQSCLAAMPYRVAPYKGVFDGLKAAALAKERLPELRLLLFGSTPLRHKLASWMTYIERPNNEDMVAIYNSVPVFIVPSWAEGWGLPGMEAMACGAALCSTDTGGVHEYAAHGQTALLSPAREPRVLADNIHRLLTDEQLRRTIAKNGVEHIKKFTWEQATNLFEDLIVDWPGR